eukprot:TRINITY_DN37048_c0_g1_i1.p1 TRINITY_DN37048_c0_g1~~TRINITY_DN37048_c0_g1_i1.p1  ORF type:complete len:344 (-),score=66.08 TRINITY_DN37048_c0_g1_i1:60-1091(-)
MSAPREHILLGMGNPLLDISADVPDTYLEKYGIERGCACLADPQHLPLYEEMVETFRVDYTAGGATQNTIRVAQWMLQRPHATTFVGCVGDDRFGAMQRMCGEKDGVNIQYLVDPTEATGTCAVLVNGKERSLIANLGAANLYKSSHLSSPTVWSLVEAAQFFYFSSFFLTHGLESAVMVCKHAVENNKTIIGNLAAPFLIEFFKEHLFQVFPYWDFIFGNEAECMAFGKTLGLGTEVKEIALKMTTFGEKLNSRRHRVVVITQGPEPTLVATEGKVTEYPVVKIPADKIVDTNGAGDSFVGGFLSQLVRGKGIDECVRAGNYAACTIIQRSGCSFPERPEFP